MSKINNKNLIFTLIFIAVLALGVVFALPTKTNAWNGYSYESEASFYTYNSNSNQVNSGGYSNNNQNPTPFITSISPDRSASGTGAKVITIIGNNFVPGSVARFDNSNRQTSYISPTKLVMQLTSADITRLGEHLITVHNDAPGGGNSNAVVFTVGKTGATGANAKDVKYDENGNPLSASALASGVFSGLFTWLIIGILILIVIVLWRKIFGDKEKNKPLKHA